MQLQLQVSQLGAQELANAREVLVQRQVLDVLIAFGRGQRVRERQTSTRFAFVNGQVGELACALVHQLHDQHRHDDGLLERYDRVPSLKMPNLHRSRPKRTMCILQTKTI
jgi:hypothetical protein